MLSALYLRKRLRLRIDNFTMAQASPTVTEETVRDYIVSRGGVVKNVELVRHFRSFLQQEDPEKKSTMR